LYLFGAPRTIRPAVRAIDEVTMQARKDSQAIDEYIAAFAPDVQAILKKIRATVAKAAPAASEKISYGIPSFHLDGNLVYFAAFKRHIGFFPPVSDAKLKKEAAVYAGEKGNLRFPLDEPIPYALITKIVKARIRENRERAAARKKK
jgi:uncharacterized protein YdhG (YjbR/CyaY superfamily)